jgi:uncharacterized protein
MEIKLEFLLEQLKGLKEVAVAFSGGVDSVFLAAAAHKALAGKAVALTAVSATFTEAEKEEAITLARQIGISHFFLPSPELANTAFTANTPQRCYFCKKERFTALRQWADKEGIPWLVEGSNADDKKDYRPGMKALQEIKGVVSPLLEAGLTQHEIRLISKEWQLPTFNKPSDACLATRLSYGLPITKERGEQVALAEKFLKMICAGSVRVRHHGNLARLEVPPSAIPLLAAKDNAAAINDYLKTLGFSYVTLDLTGYRQGSMNEELETKHG